MSKGLVYGVGINDSDYNVYKCTRIDGKIKVLWRCPIYRKWLNMLCRCYSESYKSKYPSYYGCYVSEEWLTFSNFRKWVLTQNWEDRDLDKDLLHSGNKIYSKETCLFVPKELNNFILLRENNNGLPIGVSMNGKSFVSRGCLDTKKTKYISSHTKEIDAHIEYLKNKYNLLELYIEKYENEHNLYKAINNIKEKLKYHIDNKIELVSW